MIEHAHEPEDYVAGVGRDGLFPPRRPEPDVALRRLAWRGIDTGLMAAPLFDDAESLRDLEDRFLLRSARNWTDDPIEQHRYVYHVRKLANDLHPTVRAQYDALLAGFEHLRLGRDTHEAIMARALKIELARPNDLPSRELVADGDLGLYRVRDGAGAVGLFDDL